MVKDQKRAVTSVFPAYGVVLDTAIARRERLADNYDIDFGHERVFPELTEAVLAEVPEGARVLEVGAATGLMTRPLIERAGALTAMEPSEGLLRRLLETDVASSEKLQVVRGMVEDLPRQLSHDAAVVTFTPRRGPGLLRLIMELAIRVSDRIVIMMDDDGSMDWAYLARSAAIQGFDVRVRLVQGEGGRRAVVIVADVADWEPTFAAEGAWGTDARETSVPYPAPRGAAARLVRNFLGGGDRALIIRTDPRGLERLHGNLRTAAHRLGAGEVTVKQEGGAVALVRLPRAEP